MAFSYSPDLDDDISKVRFNIGDSVENAGPRPNTDVTNFSNEEIQAVLNENSTHAGKATAVLFDTLSAEWTRFAISYTMGPRKEELYRISSRYEAMSREWANKSGMAHMAFSGGVKRRDAESGSIT